MSRLRVIAYKAFSVFARGFFFVPVLWGINSLLFPTYTPPFPLLFPYIFIYNILIYIYLYTLYTYIFPLREKKVSRVRVFALVTVSDFSAMTTKKNASNYLQKNFESGNYGNIYTKALIYILLLWNLSAEKWDFYGNW